MAQDALRAQAPRATRASHPGARAGVRGAAPARWVHPVAWWAWALGILMAASRTTNPILLALMIGVLAMVVAQRRPAAPWGAAFTASLILGLVVLASRTLLQVVFNVPVGTHVAFTLPGVDLPGWLAGVRLGGLVTWESILVGVCEGLRLATMIACVGAANSLAAPSRLLRSVPGALYEVGVAVVVALSFTPNLLADARRVSAARRLRGFEERRVRGFLRSAGPVLEGGLERSVELAAAMDSRGYGRLGPVPRRTRVMHSVLVIAGCAGSLVALYALFDSSAPPWLGWPLLALSAVVAAAGLHLGGRRSLRTAYRPDPWQGPEWITAGCGAVIAAAYVLLATGGALTIAISPLAWPQVPAAAAAVLLVGLIPGFATPLPPGGQR